MPIMSGGKVIEPSTTNLGVRTRVYWVDVLPTDANIGATAANGQIAINVTNGNVYERQAGAWVRIDTL